MQTRGHQSPAFNDEVSSTFAERAKAARLRAGLTQQQLSDRLRNESEVLLDTSAITRIEAGQREPRLGEALAIAQVLEFGLNNLVPRADLDFYMSDVERLMDESRAALVKMIRSVDPVVDFVRRNPDCLGDDRLEDRFREVFEWFHQRVAHEDVGHEDQGPLNFAITTNRTDEKLKRQLLRAVNEDILVRADEIQPAYEKWYEGDFGADRLERPGASTTGEARRGWQRTESRVHAEQWERGFSQLLDYVRQHGDARVPRSYTTHDGERLGAWVVDQRNRFARGMLDPDRSARLEELPGWTWGPRAGRSKAKTAPPGAI
jgi:transcriptional regulator with XRE-family HTH domain